MPGVSDRFHARETLAAILRGAVPSLVVGALTEKAAKHRAGLRERLATYLVSVSLRRVAPTLPRVSLSPAKSFGPGGGLADA